MLWSSISGVGAQVEVYGMGCGWLNPCLSRTDHPTLLDDTRDAVVEVSGGIRSVMTVVAADADTGHTIMSCTVFECDVPNQTQEDRCLRCKTMSSLRC
jgi:hypothetical protein